MRHSFIKTRIIKRMDYKVLVRDVPTYRPKNLSRKKDYLMENQKENKMVNF
jgi:hypothetical protein